MHRDVINVDECTVSLSQSRRAMTLASITFLHPWDPAGNRESGSSSSWSRTRDGESTPPSSRQTAKSDTPNLKLAKC